MRLLDSTKQRAEQHHSKAGWDPVMPLISVAFLDSSFLWNEDIPSIQELLYRLFHRDEEVAKSMIIMPEGAHALYSIDLFSGGEQFDASSQLVINQGLSYGSCR